MIDGIGDRGGHAGNADLADAAGAQRIDVGVSIVDDSYIDHADIGVRRHWGRAANASP